MLFQRRRHALCVHAPAKLNLFLEVLGKRADGFHELETLMVSIQLYDTLRISAPESNSTCSNSTSPNATRAETAAGVGAGLRSPGDSDVNPGVTRLDAARSNAIELVCRHSPDAAGGNFMLPTGADNLIHRAAELLRSETGVTRGVRIELWKRIPLAAGMGGGSSDAAATLAGLSRFWELGLSPAELQRLAARLGSDVPFFLADSPAAVCRGRGELITPCSIPAGLHAVIVRPATGLSTPQVFRECRPADAPRPVQPLLRALRSGDLGNAARHLHNGLQIPALRLSPDVGQLQREFARLPLYGHLLTGSGSAYFGLCATRQHALHVAAVLRARRAGSVFVARSGA